MYKDSGYETRQEYLDSLADEWGLSSHIVSGIANLLGEGEDFDGLLAALDDTAELLIEEE